LGIWVNRLHKKKGEATRLPPTTGNTSVILKEREKVQSRVGALGRKGEKGTITRSGWGKRRTIFLQKKKNVLAVKKSRGRERRKE